MENAGRLEIYFTAKDAKDRKEPHKVILWRNAGGSTSKTRGNASSLIFPALGGVMYIQTIPLRSLRLERSGLF
jgi:hypothetical protein